MLQMMGLEMGEQLGKGTAGVVHAAVSLAPDKTERVWRGPERVAVKMLHPKGNAQWQKDTFKVLRARTRLVREVSSMLRGTPSPPLKN